MPTILTVEKDGTKVHTGQETSLAPISQTQGEAQ